MRFSIVKKNKTSQKNCMKVGVKKLLRARMIPAKNIGSPCGWDVSHGEVEIEETDGSCGGKKEHDLPVFVHGSIRPGGGR